MKRCPNQPSWFTYFNNNMDDLGLPVPTSWQGTITSVVGILSHMVAVSEKFGPRVTVREVLAAGTKGEALMVAGGALATWYLGAAVGSAAVATGRYASCGTSLIDVFSYAGRQRLWSPRIAMQLSRHPEIYNIADESRRRYGLLARI